MQRHVHTAQERVNTAGLKSPSSAEPICRVGPWLAAGNLALFYPTWSAEHLLSFLKSGISVCVAGRCSYITSKISEEILRSEGQTGSPGLHAFLHFAAGLRGAFCVTPPCACSRSAGGGEHRKSVPGFLQTQPNLSVLLLIVLIKYSCEQNCFWVLRVPPANH